VFKDKVLTIYTRHETGRKSSQLWNVKFFVLSPFFLSDCKKKWRDGRIRVQRRNLDYEIFILNKLHFGAIVKDNVVVFCICRY
jgi:hypothetical protein